MDKLLAYINSLTADDQDAYAKRCKTTVGYLRKACSRKQLFGEGLCLRLSAESGYTLRPEDIRPDVDWSYLRVALVSTEPELAQVPANIGADAMQAVAGQGVANV